MLKRVIVFSTASLLAFIGISTFPNQASASENQYISGSATGTLLPMECTNWIYEKYDEIPDFWTLNTADSSRNFPFSGTLRGTFRQRCNSFYSGLQKYTSKMEIISPDGISRELVGNPRIDSYANAGRLLGLCGDITSTCFDKEEQFQVDLPAGSKNGSYSLRYTVSWNGSKCDWLGGSTFDCKPAVLKTVVEMKDAIVFGAANAPTPTVSATPRPSPSPSSSGSATAAPADLPEPLESLSGAMQGSKAKFKFAKPDYAKDVYYYSAKISFIKSNSKSPKNSANFTKPLIFKVIHTNSFSVTKAEVLKRMKIAGKKSAKHFLVQVSATTEQGESEDSAGIYTPMSYFK